METSRFDGDHVDVQAVTSKFADLVELLGSPGPGQCTVWYVPSMDVYSVFVDSFLSQCRDTSRRAVLVKIGSGFSGRLRNMSSVEVHTIDDLTDMQRSVESLKAFVQNQGPTISCIFDDISCLRDVECDMTPFGFFETMNSELQKLGVASYWPLLRGSVVQDTVAKFSGIAQLLVSVERTDDGACIHPLRVPSRKFHQMLKPYSFDFQSLGMGKRDTCSLLLDLLMQQVAEVDRLRGELIRSEERYQSLVETTFHYKNIVGRSDHIRHVCRMIGLAAQSDATVLIQGESGTGKELVAEAIHFHSPRSNGPFIRVNCAALSETLLASELFGHKKGAFTGANRSEKGRFRTADGGTLLLDEIGCMLPVGQAKLLRVLQAKEVEPVGESIPVKVDVRVIATTNLDLKRAVATGAFREDLYYRLNVFPLHLLPLRERMNDLPLLVRHFLRKYARDLKKQLSGISADALSVMEAYDWPGNVRELENAIEYAVMLETGDTLGPFSFMEKLAGTSGREAQRRPLNLRQRLGAVEKETILKALSHSAGVKSEAARLLGIDPKNLGYFLRKHGLHDREPNP